MKADFDFRRVCGSIAACLLVMAYLLGCGSGGSGSGEAGSDQGALTFRLAMASSCASPYESEFPCENELIKTVEVEVIENETTVAEGGPWACTAHKGTINDVPSGSGFKLVAYGRDKEGFAIFSGEVKGLKVEGGHTTDVGRICLNRILNRPPVLDPVGNKETPENALLTIVLSASDIDGDNLIFTAFRILDDGGTAGLPAGASLTDNFNGTGTFQWSTNYGDSGNYKILFTVTDNGYAVMEDGTHDPTPLSASESIFISVGNVNRPPVLDPIGAKTITAGEMLQFTISANDPDVDDTLTFDAENMPSGTKLTQNPDRTATFKWQTQYTEEKNDTGKYMVNFRVTDNGSQKPNGGNQNLSDSELVAITVKGNEPPKIDRYDVTEANQGSPLLDNNKKIIGFEVASGKTIDFLIVATDPNPNDILTFPDPTGLPPLAVFDKDYGDRTARFTWTSPSNRDAYNEKYGVVYQVEFTVVDNWTPPNLKFPETLEISAYYYDPGEE